MFWFLQLVCSEPLKELVMGWVVGNGGNLILAVGFVRSVGRFKAQRYYQLTPLKPSRPLGYENQST